MFMQNIHQLYTAQNPLMKCAQFKTFHQNISIHKENLVHAQEMQKRIHNKQKKKMKKMQQNTTTLVKEETSTDDHEDLDFVIVEIE